ncbi:MAG: thioredoxin family protein [Gemmatimonadota bacterium]
MIPVPSAVSLALAICLPGTTPSPVALAADTLQATYHRGIPYAEFISQAEGRRELWLSNTEGARLAPDMLERTRALGSQWYILAVTVDACSDSVSTLPYLARLAQEAENVEIRMVAPTWGQFLMDAHTSPDGRATTPTVILLDAGFRKVGCWVEQPTALQSWWLDPDPQGTSDERFARKMAWYENDGGRETVREVVEILEAAARGQHICPQW